MPKRNADVIKDLKHELGRYEKKVEYQEGQIKSLKAQVRDSDACISAQHRAVDSILAEVAVAFGQEVRPGVWQLHLAPPSVARTTRYYEVQTIVSQDEDTYIVSVQRRPEESDGEHGK